MSRVDGMPQVVQARARWSLDITREERVQPENIVYLSRWVFDA